MKIPSAAYFQLHDFKFDDIQMDDDDTLRVNILIVIHSFTVQ